MQSISSYHSSRIHRIAKWFDQEYLYVGRKFVKLKVDVREPKGYSYLGIGKRESWGVAALRMLSFAIPILVVIGLIFQLIDALAWKKYKKTSAYETRQQTWDAVFLRRIDGIRPFNTYERVLDAFIRSDIDPQEIRFKKICIKSLCANANKFYGGEGVYDHEVLEQEHIKQEEVLNVLHTHSDQYLKAKRGRDPNETENFYTENQVTLRGSTLYRMHPKDVSTWLLINVSNMSKLFEDFLTSQITHNI